MINILNQEDNKLTKEEVYLFLIKFLKEELAISTRNSLSEESFTLPSWSEYQAFQLGQQKALSKILKLIPDQGK